MAADVKTKINDDSVAAFIDAVPDDQKRADTLVLKDMFERITGEPARMWGPAIIGFGSYHYKYDSGREGDMCRLGYSPRKNELSLYVTCGYLDETARKAEEKTLARLGKHKTTKSCLHIKRLSDVDMDVLEELISDGLASMNRLYPQ